MPLDKLLALAGSPLAGAAVSLGTGAIQSLQANKLKNKADAAAPEDVDPNQLAYLAELKQKARSIETGADFASGMNAIDAAGAGTNQAIAQAAGGSSAQLIQGMLQSQKGVNAGKNQVLAQGQQNQVAYDNAYMNLLNKISARKMQMQMQRSQQYRAQWAKKAGAAGQNLMTGVTGALSALPQNSSPEGQPSFPTDWSADMSSPNPDMLSGKPNQENIMIDPNQAPPTVTPPSIKGLGDLMKLNSSI